ncbi:hypothetical protein Riv7116_1983 [Rivularia sp. PCC 7116]|uniref:hypothetical protein n=1 Tax=Rivularia sp. PCC 7116 TaxID=373994 RepID=UPI00029EEAAA|nr:hypothetical protein [Rivularia sp. PCC 7116]AFY54521.1 hypothetical protein Riv7116_1983 [Rivularia sp. PCC 7116]
MPQENQDIQPSSTQPSSSPEKLPFWKTLLVKVLRGTSGLLETTADNLETEPTPGSEEKSGFLQRLQQLWIGILGKIRLIVPVQLSAKLSDTALTGIIGGLAVIIFLVTSNAFERKPSQVAAVATNTDIPQVVSTTEPKSIVPEKETVSLPPEEETVSATQTQKTSEPIQEETVSELEEEIPSVIKTQTTSEPTKEETASKPEVEIPPLIEQKAPQEETASEKETQKTSEPIQKETASEPEVEIPPLIEQKAPQEETTSEPEIEIPPQEELEITPLTPEETLIAAIQNQVGEISLNFKGSSSSDRTFSEIIESIQANFLNSNLTIKIRNNWYSLEKKQQDKLAAEILQRSQELDFTHLEITDLQGKLIARSPVVGTEMIIFKRK